METELSATVTTPGAINVIRRNGAVTPFDANKIELAMTKAFLAVEGEGASSSSRIHEQVSLLTQKIADRFLRHMHTNPVIHIEEIQDQVELELMREAEYKVAKAYVLYREERRRAREKVQAASKPAERLLHMTLPNGKVLPLDFEQLRQQLDLACVKLDNVSSQFILDDVKRNLFDKVPQGEVQKALVMSARTLIEKEPNYSYVSARLLQHSLQEEAYAFLGLPMENRPANPYLNYFMAYLDAGIKHELLDPRLKNFDIPLMVAAIKPERDAQFTYLGLQTLFDRYFLHWEGTRFELPQAFFMRVAMGLAMEEIDTDKAARAIEFYNLLSSFDFMSSTPTLFNAGTLRPQLSSCYLTTISDDLNDIYGALKDNALLSKFAGGLGNDWTPVRGMGARIKGTNGKSQGVVPFMNVANATAVAVNQCFAPDTLLYTAKGIKPIMDVVCGDLVLGASGTYRAVLDTYTYNQTDPMVSLKLKHAIDPIHVTAGHPFYAIRGVPMEQSIERTMKQLQTGKLKGEWIDAGELQPGDYVAQTMPEEIVPVPGFTEEDAYLYGLLLGDGHLSKDGMEWGISGNPSVDTHLAFVREYLTTRGIHYWETARQSEHYTQIHWAAGRGVAREGTTGRFVSSGASTLPFSYDDIYDANHNKHIAARLAHLPHEQTLSMIQGLLETDGNVSRNKEITFCNTSRALIEGLRYQCLRLGIPTAGNKRKRHYHHTGTRADGSMITFNHDGINYDVRIPAVPALASRMHCSAVTKHNWLTYGKHVFTRVKSVDEMTPVPFVCDLKVEGDESYMTTAGLAHNGGKRKGAVCAYLETWHKDIEEFLELRKNTGDERRRTHDMNTANWIPDLFMQRVIENKDWTLFSPDEVPDLHDAYGAAFAKAYAQYEEKAAKGEIKNTKKIPAVSLWRKMLTMLFETGHPWMTFKDVCNLRSPQQHVGVVHSSNLCTEITLNTSPDEIAVCNLGSINLVAHMTPHGLDQQKLQRTIHTAMRMLDNVIDINYYSVPQARNSNLKHRPVGMGIMGFQDALYMQRIPYASEEAVQFADRSMELISYYAIEASSELAKERGTYSSYEGSLWSQGILPIDSLTLLEKNRPAHYLTLDKSSTLNWDALRQQVKQNGMRNSNVLAIAPTATISNICGVSQSIEPTYQNLFVKSNLSGEFTVINPYLVADLKAAGLWDEVMVNDLKYYNGSVAKISRIPDAIKKIYATAFEVEPTWLVQAGARRQKWIDQAQSLNLYMAQPSGKKLDQLYREAWIAGLKTTYYLRSMGATNAEKATVDDRALNAVSAEPVAPKACLITDPGCEACQ